MRILIDADSRTQTLQDQDAFCSLDAVIVGTGDPEVALAGLGRRETSHIWFDIQRLRALAGSRDAGWHERFDAMISYASSKNWIDTAGLKVRVHVVDND